MMHRLAMRLLGRRADAEDAVQEALLAFVQHVGDIRSPERVGAWLRSVTANAARRVGRRSSRLDLGRPVTDLEAPESTEDEVAEHCLSDERRRTVRAAIGRLSPLDRELLELLAAADRPSYVEIGRLLRRPVGSIGPTRRRVIARLRADPGVRELLAGV
jgi:RNA polymerase sigma factor (sigma-70 family)